jgi:chromosomal replication initiator protein
LADRAEYYGFSEVFHCRQFVIKKTFSPTARTRLTALLASLESSLCLRQLWGRLIKDVSEVAKDDREIVSVLRSALAGKVGQDRYDLWFGANTRLDYDGRSLRIGAPSRFFLEWIRANFRKHIEAACGEAIGNCPAIEFHLDATSNQGAGDSMQADASNENPKPAEQKPQQRMLQFPEESPPSAVQERRRFASLESFVSSADNRLAIASAEMVVRRPGQHTPLMFYGPTSVGKTHLLEGIWSATRKSHQRVSVVYLSAEQFTSQFLEALRGSGLPNFRRKYRGVGMLIIDDLQFLIGKRATQVELLNTIDAFLRDGRQMVFAADRSPADLAELGPELTTRLTGGLVCRIEPPDYATRLGIVAQMARRMKLHVPADVQQFVATRLTNHARELSGALCRLKAAGESLGRPISMTMAEESLSDLIRHSARAVRLPDIEKAVCDVFGLEPASLQSDAKAKRVSHPRMLAMWLARKHTRAALSEIGHFFGRRSHSTVISAQKRIDGWMAAGESMDLAEQPWAIDDAIRQVERRLAAG